MKQFSAPHLLALAALVAISLSVCIGVIVYLDKAMIEQTLNTQDPVPVVPVDSIFVIDTSALQPILKAAKPPVVVE